MEPVLRVLGAGSPHGDDQVGWRLVGALAEGGFPGCEASILRQPADLIDRAAGCDVLILVDACRSGAPAGTVTVRPWPDPAVQDSEMGSTHGLGLGWALEMARALGTAPPRVVLVGVEAGEVGPAGGLSPALRAALPGLAGRLRSLIEAEARAGRETAHLGGDAAMSHADTVLDVLREVRFLEGIDEGSLRRIASIAELREYPAGAVLFREGQAHPWIYLIAEGAVALEMRVTGDGLKRLQTVGDGELLGWSPLLGEAEMTATARAIRPTRAAAIDAAQLVALCEHDPRFGLVFLRRTAESLASRLNATRLQLMDVYRHELPVAPSGQEG